MINTNNAAIVCTIDELFEHYDRNLFTSACEKYVSADCGMQVGKLNRESWKDCYDFLERELGACKWSYDIYAAFEFKMPDSQKRADVILLTKEKVVILEFKCKENACLRDALQVGGYHQSIKSFHSATVRNNMDVRQFLTLTKRGKTERSSVVDILSETDFRSTLHALFINDTTMTSNDAKEWVAASFYPSKSMCDLAKQVFETKKLPHIKSISDAEIQSCLDMVTCIVNDNTLHKNLVFVTGVPGSGKTLVGLKLVYDRYNPATSNDQDPRSAFISGNASLIDILSNSLQYKVDGREGSSFIHPLGDYEKPDIPNNDVIVFDEAQRARNKPGKSDAEQLLSKCDEIAERHNHGISLVCIIGEGQAIGAKEEEGMHLWANALRNHTDWNVFSSGRLRHSLSACPNYIPQEGLSLHISIRTGFLDTAPLVESILDCNFEKAHSQHEALIRRGLKTCVFRQWKTLKEVIEEHNSPDEHTGLIISSHNLGTDNSPLLENNLNTQYVTSTRGAYQWYMKDSYDYRYAASEYIAQGIDLEWPVVGFLGDYYLNNGSWQISPSANLKMFKNKSMMIKNVYRVLLTRARKGLYLFVPEDPMLDETYETLRGIIQTDLPS